jgi:catechol 2,3-dioxygenase-like lactoylglutathione lyase family enzyme
MSRVQLALNVSNLDEAIEFYSKFFNSEPKKVRVGYANFAIEEPPLKLVLIENKGVAGSINHLGVEVSSTDEVVAATRYLSDSGLAIRREANTTCCYALQDKVWVDGVDGSPWEVYTVLADSPTSISVEGDGGCCASNSRETPSESLAEKSCC